MATRNNIDVVFRIRGQIARTFKEAASAARGLGKALKQVDSESRRASTGLAGIAKSMAGIGSSLPILLGSGGLAVALKTTADTAFQANAQMMVFKQTLRAFGQDIGEGIRLLNQVSQELQVAPEQAAASASLMLRAGYDMKEVVAAFEAGAASALAAGKTVKSGIENVALALSTGLSIYLNYIGIAENIGPVIRRAIAAHKDAAPEIVKAAQNQAALNVVLRATAQEVKALPVLLGGYQGAINRMNVALFNLSKTVGQEVLPGITALIQDLTAAFQLFVSLPPSMKAFAVGASAAAIAVTTLGSALAALKMVVGVLGGPAGLVMALISVLGGLAAVIYNRTKRSIDEGTKALERLAEASAGARDQIHKTNLAMLESEKLMHAMPIADALKKYREQFKELTPLAQTFYESLQKGLREGKGEQVVNQLVQSYRKLRDAGPDALSLEDMKQLSRLIDLVGRSLRSEVVALDEATRQLEAYKKAARELNQEENKPPPKAKDVQVLKDYENTWKEISNLPVFKGSYFRELNRQMGLTADAIERIAAHTKVEVPIMSTMSPDTFERLQNRLEGVANAAKETEEAIRQIYVLAPAINAAAAPDAMERNAQHAAAVAAAVEREKEQLEKANAEVQRQKELWKQISEIPVLRASYWIQINRELGTTADTLERIAAHSQRVEAPSMGAMSPDTFEHLQARLDGSIQAAKELRENLDYIIKGPPVTGPDAMERNYEHALKAAAAAEKAKENAEKLKAQTEAAAKAAAALQEAYQRAADTVSATTNAVTKLIDGVKKAASGDAKGAFESISSGIADLAKLIPVVGGLISAVISLISAVVVAFWDAITDPTGARRAEKAIKKVADGYKLIGKEAFEAAKKTKTLERWTIFGVQRVTKYVVDKEVLDRIKSIAGALEQGIFSAMRNGIKRFLDGAADAFNTLKQGIKSAIEDAIVEAVIQGAIVKGALGTMLTSLTEALSKGDYGMAQNVIREIASAIPSLTQQLQQLLGPLRDTLGQTFGSSTPGTGPGTGGGTSSNALIYQLPQVPIVTIPTWVDIMASAVAKFDQAVDRLLQGTSNPFGLRGVL